MNHPKRSKAPPNAPPKPGEFTPLEIVDGIPQYPPAFRELIRFLAKQSAREYVRNHYNLDD